MSGIENIKKILEDHESRLRLLEQKIELPAPHDGSVIKEAGIGKLAKKVGSNIEKLESLFDIENNSLTILKAAGNDEADKTKKITLMVLLGYKYIFGIESVLSKEIRRNVAENRIPLNNFATYLNEMIPSLIRRIGKLKSKTTMYKLNPLGEAEAKEIVKQLCNDEK
jgi:hypothetical protein